METPWQFSLVFGSGAFFGLIWGFYVLFNGRAIDAPPREPPEEPPDEDPDDQDQGEAEPQPSVGNTTSSG